MPIILNLYCKPLKASIPCFMAMNSAQNTDVSTVDCLFEYHSTNPMLTYINKPLHDLWIYKTLCPQHDHYQQTCECLPPFHEVLVHSPVLPPWHLCKTLTNHIRFIYGYKGS